MIQRYAAHLSTYRFLRPWLLFLLLACLGPSSQLLGQVTANFSVNLQSGCSPLTVQFINQSTGPITDYLWDFGNGNTSTLANPGAVYINPGTYTVSLTVSNAGSSDTRTLAGLITVFAEPTAAFAGDVLSGCAPLDVCFNDLSTPGDGAISSWLWDFGDGTISTDAAPCHAYAAPGSYDVTLVVEDENGCTNTLIQPNYIDVTTTHSADFSVTTSTPCQLPADIAFTSSVTPAGTYTYAWDFGDGITSTLANPTHTYAAGGAYSVSLVVRDPSGCQDSVYKEDIVQIQAPTAAFNVLNTNACARQPVSFVNNSGGADSYFWSFGDGSSSLDANPVHTYATAGTYTVSLVATNTSQGCSDTLVQDAFITVNTTPVADFSSPNRTGCEVPKLVDFVDASVGAVEWDWDFGDGNTANVQNPSHEYLSGGNYTVTLVVTNAAGCKDTLVRPSYVQLAPPVAEFIPSPLAGCIPLTVNFLDISQSRDSITTWIWDFGDGGTSQEQNPSHTYTTVGQYAVRLVVLTASGCRDTMIYDFIEAGEPPLTDFFANPQTVCAEDSVDFIDQSNQALTWYWSFGDGNFSDLQNPSHQYTDTGTFDVMLISELYGCPDTLIREDYITVLGPIAEFTTSSTTGCQLPYTLDFIDLSTDADSWQWDFGDGNFSTEQSPTHTYTSLGAFTVTLTASNSQTGCSYQTELELDVSEPIANFVPSATSGCTGSAISFTNNSVGAVSYFWDFGDGNTSTEEAPTHLFRDPGSFDVMLIITNSAGCTDTLLREDLIQIVGPDGDFTADLRTGCAPLTVSFSGTGSTVPASESISSYRWDFGDGSTFTSQNPVYTYNEAGDYTVSLVLLDSQGCTDTITKENFISPTFPEPDFEVPSVQVCPGSPITFDNQTEGVGLSFLWDFGDGNTSTAIHPVHVYDMPGTYAIRLTATDINGCTNTLFRDDFLQVSPPVANFFASPTQQACPPLAVTFSDLSSADVVSWRWDFGDGSTSDLPNPSKVYGIPGSFDVSLIVENAQGCSDTLLLPDLVELGGPLGSFDFEPKTGCSPLEVTFTSSTDSAVSWTWDFGDGSLGFGQTTTHTYTSDTIARPVLIVRDTAGCTVAIPSEDSVVIRPGPNPSFVPTQTELCLGQSIGFQENSNSSLPIIQYQWNFGDGSTSLQANPQHVYNNPGSYQVFLIATSLNGCVDTAVSALPIQVQEPPEAVFTPSVLEGCVPLDVTFSDQSSSVAGIASYRWSFGDGDSAEVPFPAHTFDAPGNYRVRLEIEDNQGCTDSVSRVITITSPPTAEFSSSTRIGCAPREIQFTSQSTGPSTITQWFWDFGDGGTSTERNPTYTYQNNGLYTVSLTVTDDKGCSDTEVKTEYIDLRRPLVDFTADQTVGCPPQAIQFTHVVDTQVPITNWFWEFGDGTTSTEADPSHTFTEADTFDVQLIVVNALGCADTLLKPRYIRNHTPPTAAFTPSDTTLCAPEVLQVQTNSTAGSSPITRHLYRFGDGDTAQTPTASKLYQDEGSFAVELIVTDFNGCRDTARQLIQVAPPITADFGTDDSLGCTTSTLTFFDLSQGPNAPVSWAWDFGDGTTSSQQFPTHVYAEEGRFDVSLKVVDGNGCVDSLTKGGFVNIDGPEMAFSSDLTQLCPEESVLFTDQSTGPSPIVAWRWDFGDGNSSTEQNPQHRYAEPGSYQVMLRITDSTGCTLTDTLPNNLTVIEGPRAAFLVSDSLGCAPLRVELTDESVAGTVPIATRRWDFGNGNTANGAAVSATYGQTGSYDLQLVVTGANGCTDTASHPIEVLAAPVAAFRANDSLGCAPQPVVFSDLSSSSAPIVAWRWTFGDGNASDEQFPEHTYQEEGLYSVSLSITDENGCVDSVVRPEYIFLQNPRADFFPDKDEACPGEAIQFSDASTGPRPFVSWLWDFGDGTQDSSAQPTHAYTEAGRYTVTLTVTDSLGCLASETKVDTIQVFMPPTPSLTVSDSLGCPPLRVAFSDASTPNDARIVAWDWDLGNGVTGDLRNATTLYEAPGPYQARLTVTDAKGCVDSVLQRIEVVSPPEADFVMPLNRVCKHEAVAFVDVSRGQTEIVAWQWTWNDSLTSNEQNPLQVFAENGNIDVQLAVEDANGCRDTVLRPTLLEIFGPEIAFDAVETQSCVGQAVAFTDQTDSESPVIAWRWRFGDGDTATVPNPNHVYTQAGTYSVSLSVETELGCRDTLRLPQLIEVTPGPQALFAASDTAVCLPAVVEFTDGSMGDAPIVQWNWDIDGVPQGMSQDITALFDQAGTYEVGLQVTDEVGCVGRRSQIVEVFAQPEADFIASDTVGCAPANIVFQDQSSPIPVRWAWSFGDSAISNNQNPVHRYEDNGRYTVSLKITDRNGCVDSVTKNQYIFLRQPEGDFAVDYEPGCPPIPADFVAVATSPYGIASLSWDFGDGNEAMGMEVSNNYVDTGSYTVTLFITDSLGCVETLEKPDFVHIQGNEAPVPVGIHRATVDRDDQVTLTFAGYRRPDFAAYRVYREVPTGSANWQQVHETAFLDDTVWVETGLEATRTSYCYKVTVVNNCGQESLLAASPKHCTVELQAGAEPDRILVSWNTYTGWEVSAYELYRVQSYSTANVELVTTVPGFVSNYIDSSAFCTNTYHYRVKALGLDDGQVSWSDTATVRSAQSQPVEPSEIYRVSVEQNRFLRVEWLPFDDREAEVIYIERRASDERSWTIAGQVAPGTLSYVDTLVDVSRLSYSYRLHALDSCGGSYPYSNVASSILLELTPQGPATEAGWTPYLGWELGVARYEVEVFDDILGVWKILAVVQGGDTTFLDDNPALNQPDMCYRIRAFEQGGNEAQSLSNEMCRPVVPDLYAPNAFTPNLDNINDEFFLEGLYITDFHLRIFNQWGQVVFESRNLEEGWNGTFRGQAVPEGVYVYVARGKGFHGVPFERSGTVTLIR